MNTSRRQFNRWITATLATATLGFIALAGTPKAGEAFPDLAQAGLEGKVPELAGKVVVVDFWASWCGPCKKALPILADLNKEYAPKGVVFVAVSLDEEKSDMEAYLKKNPIPFAVVRDAKGKLAEKLSIGSIPMSFVIAADGKVSAVHEGFEGEKVRAKYAAQLDQLLKK